MGRSKIQYLKLKKKCLEFVITDFIIIKHLKFDKEDWCTFSANQGTTYSFPGDPMYEQLFGLYTKYVSYFSFLFDINVMVELHFNYSN